MDRTEKGGPDRTASLGRTDRPERRQGASRRKRLAAERVRIEEPVAEAARRQHGLVTRVQLRAAGLGADAVKYRVATGRLHAVQRGVYRAGPLALPLEREMAAVLASGAGAALSHRSAAVHWELLPPPAERGLLDVTVRGAGRRRLPGVRPHASTRLPADEVTVKAGIPITTAGRTLLDLAGAVAAAELEEALGRAERLGLAGSAELTALLARYPRMRGARKLRALLGVTGGAALTRSEAEQRLLELVRLAQLPTPQTNQRAAGYEVDLLWPRERVVVEVDGFAFHGSRGSFEHDRKRDARLLAAGLAVMRVTWRQIVREPHAVVARLAQALVRPPGGTYQPT